MRRKVYKSEPKKVNAMGGSQSGFPLLMQSDNRRGAVETVPGHEMRDIQDFGKFYNFV